MTDLIFLHMSPPRASRIGCTSTQSPTTDWGHRHIGVEEGHTGAWCSPPICMC